MQDSDLDKVLEVEVHCCQEADLETPKDDFRERIQFFCGKTIKVEEFQNFGGNEDDDVILPDRRRAAKFRRRFGRLPRGVGDHTFTVHKDLYE